MYEEKNQRDITEMNGDLNRYESNGRVSKETDTYFAPPDRAIGEELKRAVQVVDTNPVMDALLKSFGGIVAVLNQHRQIVAVNSVLLNALGVEDPQLCLGLRPGEALNCIHANDHSGGCGTSKSCRHCGAVLAILGSQESRLPREQECLLTARRGNVDISMEFLARAVPIDCNMEHFTLLLLQDISDRKRREALERTFFHDIRNSLAALQGSADLLNLSHGTMSVELAADISRITMQILHELENQRDLIRMEAGRYDVSFKEILVADILQNIRNIFMHHELCHTRKIDIDPSLNDIRLHTSPILLQRVLSNMILNALEATDFGGTVRLWPLQENGCTTICVWNRQEIPEDIANRIFQRFFSTKANAGRGLGTYSMKLLGERYLGGKVSFTTSDEQGTVFQLCLPTVQPSKPVNTLTM